MSVSNDEFKIDPVFIFFNRNQIIGSRILLYFNIVFIF